jgi:hypothetical protein
VTSADSGRLGFVQTYSESEMSQLPQSVRDCGRVLPFEAQGKHTLAGCTSRPSADKLPQIGIVWHVSIRACMHQHPNCASVQAECVALALPPNWLMMYVASDVQMCRSALYTALGVF